ncbi:Rne/Rng family ribonuclease [Kosmotoga pacifica]|nr:Rne/Rng family ribonuclease [Kosmotoga pacifica]
MRIAILDNGSLEEVFFEEMDNESYTGNIYLGKIENVVPSLEAAFVNIGIGKNAFLRFKDSPANQPLEKGKKILVQVKKDPIGSKGPQVTLKVSIPGRSLVYIPFSRHIGISKRITETEERDRLMKIARESLKEGEGVIFRTAAYGVSAETIQEELEALRNLWQKVEQQFKRGRKPKLLYEEPSLVEYILRERLTENTREIVVDNEYLWHDVVQGISRFKSGFKPIVRFVEDDAFAHEGIYEMLKVLYTRVVHLESGGNIIIDRTEAMTVIDVNSASDTSGNDVAETSLKTNLEAAAEIARQLRLRNIGGIIVIDFIDMKSDEARQKVIERLSEELKKDKARSYIMGFTKLGLLEMTRKRSTAAIGSKIYSNCPICKGVGLIEAPKIVYQRLLKDLHKGFKDAKIKSAEVEVYQSLSGILTPDVQKNLAKHFKRNLKFSFTWPVPTTYNIKFSKK